FQIKSYEEAFPSAQVRYFPIVTYKTHPRLHHNDNRKDIDVFFSGSITPERQQSLHRLEKKGLKVVYGMWSEVLRDHYLNRSKVCLQLKQNPNWPFPSVMRIHHLLASGNLVLSERCEVPCLQEEFTTTFTGEE